MKCCGKTSFGVATQQPENPLEAPLPKWYDSDNSNDDDDEDDADNRNNDNYIYNKYHNNNAYLTVLFPQRAHSPLIKKQNN